MPLAKSRVDNIHDQMPALYDTRQNQNWKALIEAIGLSDQATIELIEAAREQFFIKTAKRPYLDRLGAASLVQRPRFVGMDDPTFRRFIPIMAYNPKQVKLILDDILDIFFFKDSTTSFISSSVVQPYSIKSGWELEYEIDSYIKERIEFKESDFIDINNISAAEIVAAINRQASNSYAIAFENSITKQTNVRIFTNTVGAKGSVQITGGRANIALQFDGFNTESGYGGNTEWEINKIGNTVTMTYTGVGNSPKIENLSIGDIVIITKPSNVGSFIIKKVDVASNSFTFENLFATDEVFTQSTDDDVKFFIPFKANVYLRERRAVVWEVRPGEVIIEIPPSPPVVKRNRKGAAHINGIESLVTSFNRLSSNMVIEKPDRFPIDGGNFYFIPENEIQTYFPNDGDTTYFHYSSRLSSDMPVYSYVSRVGNLLQGITPSLPLESSDNRFNLTSANRDSSNTITVTTTIPHNYKVGQSAVIEDAVLGAGIGADVNGAWKITSIISATQFTAYSFGGSSGTRLSTAGTVRVEKPATSTDAGLVILRSAQIDPTRLGPYVWDQNSDFVLSSLTASLISNIKAGSTQKNIQLTPNDIPNEQGQLIFDFGTERQEGPVRYLFKPSSSALALDPSYVFKNNHDIGSSVTMIRRRGGVDFDGFGSERAPYITDPSAARETLKELVEQVKSVGIFVNFLVRYPIQYYATIDVYRSGIDPG
jgi:hypothetical protein